MGAALCMVQELTLGRPVKGIEVLAYPKDEGQSIRQLIRNVLEEFSELQSRANCYSSHGVRECYDLLIIRVVMLRNLTELTNL